MHGVRGLHLYFYTGKLRLQGEQFTISAGTASITPPETPLEWEFPDHAPHYYVHFIPGATSAADDPVWSFPVINGPFEHFDNYVRDMELIGSSYEDQPLKAQVCLWNLLWRISDENAHMEPILDSLPSSVPDCGELHQPTLQHANRHPRSGHTFWGIAQLSHTAVQTPFRLYDRGLHPKETVRAGRFSAQALLTGDQIDCPSGGNSRHQPFQQDHQKGTRSRSIKDKGFLTESAWNPQIVPC